MRPYEIWRRVAAQVGPTNDPYWSDVVVLLNMGGADGSTTFTDSKGLRTWTAHGNVQIDDSLGYNTAYFDGSGDYISAPYVKADMDWWTSDYTIEAWINAGSFENWSYLDGDLVPAMIGCASTTSATNYWSFGPRGSTNALVFNYYNGSSAIRVVGGTVPSGSVQHVAMVKTAAGIRLAVNGVLGSTAAITGTPQSSTSGVVLTHGMINNRSIQGHVKALRITRAARYTSNFSPPAAPFPVG